MDSKSIGGNTVRVRVPPRPLKIETKKERLALAYIIGIALGDGNLSNPNGRASRLRVTCDVRYPNIQKEIIENLKILLPNNSIAIVKRPKNCVDISVFSNEFVKQLPWKVGLGSKYKQNTHVPSWILKKKKFTKECLRGLLQTDGSIYLDRGYRIVNFTNNTFVLSKNVLAMMRTIGFEPTFHQAMNDSSNKKYTVRIAKKTDNFIEAIRLSKS